MNKTESEAIKTLTQEWIDKYPGSIQSLKKDWSGIIDDILTLVKMEKQGSIQKIKTCNHKQLSLDDFSGVNYLKCPDCNKLVSFTEKLPF